MKGNFFLVWKNLGITNILFKKNYIWKNLFNITVFFSTGVRSWEKKFFNQRQYFPMELEKTNKRCWR